MTKNTLIEAVIHSSKNTPSIREANAIVDGLFSTLSKHVAKEGRVSIPGFGTFTVRSRKARTGRNPQTQKEIQIPASKTVSFKPAPVLRKSL